jgi:hypothetical protein
MNQQFLSWGGQYPGQAFNGVVKYHVHNPKGKFYAATMYQIYFFWVMALAKQKEGLTVS